MTSISNISSSHNERDYLFDFIKPNDNDLLSLMKGIDLQELLYRLDNYYLELRDKLGFSDSVTFGLELEFEKACRRRIEERLEETGLYTEWDVKGDGSLDNGAEINSPVLVDEEINWIALSKVCDIVKEHAIIGKNSGGHIHVGTHVLGTKTESWLNFIKLWSVYENIIFRFLYGDSLTHRASLERYAPPISKCLWGKYQFLKRMGNMYIGHLIYELPQERYGAINFSNTVNPSRFSTGNTIEFRCPNGTLEPVIWQNNVNLLINILNYSKSSNFDDDTINKRREINQDKYSELGWYNQIYLVQALELADMLFDSNLDKVYFLRQYLKSFQIGESVLDKPKSFVKKK